MISRTNHLWILRDNARHLPLQRPIPIKVLADGRRSYFVRSDDLDVEGRGVCLGSALTDMCRKAISTWESLSTVDPSELSTHLRELREKYLSIIKDPQTPTSKRVMTRAQQSGVSAYRSVSNDWLVCSIIWIAFVGIMTFLGWALAR